MGLRGRLLQQQVLLGPIVLAAIAAAAAAASEPTNSSCIRRCGSLQIPYPFGTSEGCYLDPSFLITCNNSTPFLGYSNELKVLGVSMDGEMRVSSKIARDCPNEPGYDASKSAYGFSLLDPFRISSTKNKFTAVGCDTLSFFVGIIVGGENLTTGCGSLCDRIENVGNGSCDGIGCCQTSIPQGMSSFSLNVSSFEKHSTVADFNPCGFGFVSEEEAYNFSSLDLMNLQNKETVPMVLDWTVGNGTCTDAETNLTSYGCKAKESECYNSINGPGYFCNCSSGYEGNPYLYYGCQDINECEIANPCDMTLTCNNIPGSYKCGCLEGYEGDGMKNGTGCHPIVSNSPRIAADLGVGVGIGVGIGIGLPVLLGGFFIYRGWKRRNLIKLKRKFFKQNGGLILRQQLSNHIGSIEPIKIFSIEELKRATNNYDESMILGQGGKGIVYKGVLPGNKVVAIKKSKLYDHNLAMQFINEVFLLTQINHMNVVKLLGCCLETDVPLLVYEFIRNGTLFYHIHDKSPSSSLTWENRLKIAGETAGALAYLHFEVSMPIIHGDVKTSNILLDDNLTAKVAGFEASRQISFGQTKVNSSVQGTLGYLDPEYLYTGQLTEKSDVYSFGVVLAELLTGRKVISFDETESNRNLSMSFVSTVNEDRLLQILDDHIINEDNIEDLREAANLAKRCLSVRGEDRPSMKEVAMELEGLRIMKKRQREKADLYAEETEYLPTEPEHHFSIDVGTGCSSTDTTTG